jgi:hypothetical protein
MGGPTCKTAVVTSSLISKRASSSSARECSAQPERRAHSLAAIGEMLLAGSSNIDAGVATHVAPNSKDAASDNVLPEAPKPRRQTQPPRRSRAHRADAAPYAFNRQGRGRDISNILTDGRAAAAVPRTRPEATWLLRFA